MRRAKQIYRAAPLIKSTSDSALTLKLVNNSFLVALPSTPETSRGLSCSMLLADEAARCSDDLILSCLPFTAARKNAKVCFASTPSGSRGIWYRLWKEQTSGYKKIQITCDEIPRISRAYIERMKLEMGDRWLQQEFYCKFTDNEASVFSNRLITNAVRSFDSLDELLEDVLNDDEPEEAALDGEFQFSDLDVDIDLQEE